MLLGREFCQLGVIDVQERLIPAIHNAEPILESVGRLVSAARILSVPVWVSEQYPTGLGRSVSPIKDLVSSDETFSKTAFSCARDASINQHVASQRRRQIILCGVEAHVCVLQTALEFKLLGYDVSVVMDAVSSRKEISVEAALARMRAEEVRIVTAEMVLFEWIGDSSDPAFKDLRPMIV